MKSIFTVLLACCVIGLAAHSHADVLAYEGFGDAASGVALNGYSGTNAESGLTGTWTVTGDSAGTTMVSPPSNGTAPALLYGYAPEAVGGTQHCVRKSGWSIGQATRPLSSTVDLSADGTYYMSFLASCDSSDFTGQVGLANATNELMAGNAWSWGGLTAYYGAIGTAVDKNNNGTKINGTWGSGDRYAFFIVTFDKTNSGSTNDLAVTVDFYDLGTSDPADISRVPDVTRTIQLTGVSDVFDSLKFKVGGWPNIDEIRLGYEWADVAGFIPPPPPMEISGTYGLGDELTFYNGGFTLPGYKTTGLDGVIDWKSFNPAGYVWHGDSGIDDNDSTDGDDWCWNEKIPDGPIYNITTTPMVEGQDYTFTADLNARWSCDGLKLSVVAGPYTGSDPNVSGGIGDPNIALAEVLWDKPADRTWYPGWISYTATAADAGKFIGIMVEGYSASNINNSWIRLDNVRFYEGTKVLVHGVVDNQPDGSTAVPALTPTTLTWTPSNDPNVTGQVVHYLVSNTMDMATYKDFPVTATLSATDDSYSIGTMDYDHYLIWRVDTVIDANTYNGTTYIVQSESSDFPPVVTAGPGWLTWVGGPMPTLTAAVDDLGEGDVTNYAKVVWTVDPDDTGATVTPTPGGSPMAPTADFNATAEGDYTITVTVTDDGGAQGEQSDSDTLVVRVAPDACTAATSWSGVSFSDYDSDRDCDVDIIDFADFALQWLDDIALTDMVQE